MQAIEIKLGTEVRIADEPALGTGIVTNASITRDGEFRVEFSYDTLYVSAADLELA